VPWVAPAGTEQAPEQQSPFTVHAASSPFSVHAGGDVVPPSLDFLQPPAVTASAASADTRSVESLGVRMTVLRWPRD
jgi:hypothetical protein